MIQVLLLILKIIGITVLVLLLTVLVVLALVLFVPVRYRARIIHNPEKNDIYGRADFLFPLVVFRFRFFEKEFSYKGRAFWYVFAESGKNKKKKPEKKEKEKQAKADSPRTEVQKADTFDTDSIEAEAEETKEILKKVKPLKEPEKEKKKEKEKKPGMMEKNKRLLRQKDEVLRILSKEESKEAIAVVFDQVKKTLRHILPRKIKGYLIYGSEDPSTTGKVLGLVSVFYAAAGPVFQIVPDFERARLECDLEFKGRLQIFTLLVILLKIYFNSELKEFVQEMKAIKEIE